jgi:hypothetical protein
MDYNNNMDYQLTSKEDLEDSKWKEIYIGTDANGIKYKKTMIKTNNKPIVRKDGNKEFFDEHTFREWTPNGYVYKRVLTFEEIRQKRIEERKKWKPFGEYTEAGKKIDTDVYIELTNPSYSSTHSDLNISSSEEYTPPTLTTITKKTSSDEYQLPENLISSITNKITVVVSNIITTLNDNDLFSLIKEMAEENGIPTKITIPAIKFVYDRQSRTEKPLPRLAFIEYPHEADAHYSIEYLNKKVIEHNIIEAALQTKKLN